MSAILDSALDAVRLRDIADNERLMNIPTHPVELVEQAKEAVSMESSEEVL